jgi:hypothetical protein
MSDKTTKVPEASTAWAEWTRAWEPLTERSRSFARLAIDGIEAAVDNAIAFERNVGNVVPFDWVREAIVVRTTLADEAKAAWVKVARAVVDESSAHLASGSTRVGAARP